MGFIRRRGRVRKKMRYQVIFPPLLPSAWGARGAKSSADRFGSARRGSAGFDFEECWLAGWLVGSGRALTYIAIGEGGCERAPPTALNGNHCITPIMFL